MNGLPAKLWHSKHRPVVAAACTTAGAALLLSVASLGWSVTRLQAAASDLEIERQGLTDVELIERDIASLDAELPRRETRLRALLAGGFLEAADRVGWAEAVVARADDLRPLSYSVAIGAPQWLPLPQPVIERQEGHAADERVLHATDLALQVSGVHEDELLRLIEAALSAGGGVTRIEQCHLARRPDDVGLDIDCTLRRFGLGLPPSNAASGALEPAS